MRVADLLNSKPSEVMTLKPWATVQQGLAKLAGPPRIGAVVVTGEEGGVIGTLSERDIVRALTLHGAGVLTRTADTVMSRDVPLCHPEDGLARVTSLMTVHRFRHLPVVRGHELLGVVSIGDVVRARLEESELEAAVLRDMVLAHE